jgi:hypothetical protein
MIHTSGKVAQEQAPGGQIIAMSISSDVVEISRHYKSNGTPTSPPNTGRVKLARLRNASIIQKRLCGM